MRKPGTSSWEMGLINATNHHDNDDGHVPDLLLIDTDATAAITTTTTTTDSGNAALQPVENDDSDEWATADHGIKMGLSDDHGSVTDPEDPKFTLVWEGLGIRRWPDPRRGLVLRPPRGSRVRGAP